MKFSEPWGTSGKPGDGGQVGAAVELIKRSEKVGRWLPGGAQTGFTTQHGGAMI